MLTQVAASKMLRTSAIRISAKGKIVADLRFSLRVFGGYETGRSNIFSTPANGRYPRGLAFYRSSCTSCESCHMSASV
jgi:hypothetical protein